MSTDILYPAACALRAEFPAETPVGEPPSTLETFTRRINTALTMNYQSYMATAVICAQADATLSPAEKRQMMKGLNCSKGTFSKLAAIGRNPRLQEVRWHDRLPVERYTVLHELSRYTPDQFDAAMQAGIIHPKATRSEIRGYIHPDPSAGKAERIKLPKKGPEIDALPSLVAQRLSLEELGARYRNVAHEFPLRDLVTGNAPSAIPCDYAVIRIPNSLTDQQRGDFLAAVNDIRDRFHTETRIETLPLPNGS